ncbi:glutaredoxin subgroup I [Tribonema minus]|uniref:Glutaredoxin subgroup I n=1 Tax=Tribonema minus TaxID=303371 RepID=A0A836CN42_9STRA|nr:glutaredoxin subgroup I [Tribonema minus]
MSSSSGEAVKAVQDKIDSTKVLVYEKWGCPFCGRVKDLLEDLALEPEPEFIELDGHVGASTQRALMQLTGQRTVPNVFIGGTHVGGCDDTMAAVQSGKLKELLDKAGVRSSNLSKM